MTLTDFLLARLDEDEAEAREYQHYQENVYEAAGWWDCDRVLAECEAKRRIIALHHATPGTAPDSCDNCSYDGIDETRWIDYPCETLRLLAAPFKSHPDFDESWAI